MLILANTAYATTKSSQHCFLGTQTGKHLLRKQNRSEKETNSVSPTNVSFARKQGNMFPRFRGPLYPPGPLKT